MKIVSLPFAMLLCGLTACATNNPVAVQCPEMAPVSRWMMEPSKNSYLLTPISSKNAQQTPPSSEPSKTTASETTAL